MSPTRMQKVRNLVVDLIGRGIQIFAVNNFPDLTICNFFKAMTTRASKPKGRRAMDKPVALPSNNTEDGREGSEEDQGSSENGEEEQADEDEDSENEGENDQGVPLSDLDSDAGEGDVDLVPYQKLYKDNHAALTQALSTFALPISTLPFHVHQSVTSSETVTIDVNDDLSRELAFYKQALEAAQEGREQLLAEGLPFSRPSDYFAEMIKDDEHMDKVDS
jgi:rRNA-processing protein EBP2